MVHEEMPFKGISYLELWQPFCSAGHNHLCNFGRGYYEEQLCEIHFNFWSVVQEEMSSIRFLIWSSGCPPDRWSGTIYAILEEGIMGNIHVKLYELWICGSGGNVL